MELMKLAGFCAACVLLAALLRKKTPEQALLLTIGAVVLVLARCLGAAAPLVERLQGLFAQAGVEGEHVAILLRTVGAALVTRLCADLCRDGGSQSLATAVEAAGAVAALLISLPLLQAVVELLLGYFT